MSEFPMRAWELCKTTYDECLDLSCCLPQGTDNISKLRDAVGMKQLVVKDINNKVAYSLHSEGHYLVLLAKIKALTDNLLEIKRLSALIEISQIELQILGFAPSEILNQIRTLPECTGPMVQDKAGKLAEALDLAMKDVKASFTITENVPHGLQAILRSVSKIIHATKRVAPLLQWWPSHSPQAQAAEPALKIDSAACQVIVHQLWVKAISQVSAQASATAVEAVEASVRQLVGEIREMHLSDKVHLSVLIDFLRGSIWTSVVDHWRAVREKHTADVDLITFMGCLQLEGCRLVGTVSNKIVPLVDALSLKSLDADGVKELQTVLQMLHNKLEKMRFQ
eukprot:gene28374-35161_t